VPHVSKRLRGSIKRLPDLIDMETALFSATSALECPVTLNPAKRHAALVATQRATNDLDITGIERGFIQSTQLLPRLDEAISVYPISRRNLLVNADTDLTSRDFLTNCALLATVRAKASVITMLLRFPVFVTTLCSTAAGWTQEELAKKEGNSQPWDCLSPSIQAVS
jgi:hypothetical protein